MALEWHCNGARMELRYNKSLHKKLGLLVLVVARSLVLVGAIGAGTNFMLDGTIGVRCCWLLPLVLAISRSLLVVAGCCWLLLEWS